MTISQSLSFNQEEYAARLAKVRARMDDRGLNALLIHEFSNICYLSGLQSTNTSDYYALIVPLVGEPVLVLWHSELGNALLTSWVQDNRTYPKGGDGVALATDTLHDMGLDAGRVGIEKGATFASHYRRIETALPRATLVDCTDLLQGVRLIKSPAEIEYIRQAGIITSAAMQACIDAARVGGTDQEMAAAAHQTAIAMGSEAMCSPPVVSAGRLAGIPHANHRRIVLRKGDTALLELSACIHRYSAPIMRSVVLGKPNATVRRMADAIRATLNAVIEAMQPGAAADDIARIGEKLIVAAPAKCMDLFHDTYAYSIGLGFPPGWGDTPHMIIRGSDLILQPGMSFHLPISLRYPGRYGVAMSETVVITETGNVVMTDVSCELFERKLRERNNGKTISDRDT